MDDSDDEFEVNVKNGPYFCFYEEENVIKLERRTYLHHKKGDILKIPNERLYNLLENFEHPENEDSEIFVNFSDSGLIITSNEDYRTNCIIRMPYEIFNFSLKENGLEKLETGYKKIKD